MSYTEDGTRYHACRDCKEIFPLSVESPDAPA